MTWKLVVAVLFAVVAHAEVNLSPRAAALLAELPFTDAERQRILEGDLVTTARATRRRIASSRSRSPGRRGGSAALHRRQAGARSQPFERRDGEVQRAPGDDTGAVETELKNLLLARYPAYRAARGALRGDAGAREEVSEFPERASSPSSTVNVSTIVHSLDMQSIACPPPTDRASRAHSVRPRSRSGRSP